MNAQKTAKPDFYAVVSAIAQFIEITETEVQEDREEESTYGN